MERTERLSTSVTPEHKTAFRVAAAEQDMEMAELLRDLVHEYLEEEGKISQGNPKAAATMGD